MTEINQLKEEITRLHKRVAELEQHGDLNHKTDSQLQLLKSISLLHEVFWDKGIHYGWCNNVIENLLTLSNSEFGFICELFHKEDGTPFIKSHGISNILWSAEVKKLYEENIENGLDFFNFKSIWGNAITTGELYISHTPENDPHGYSKKQGHPPLKSFMGIPIKDSKDEVVGIVGMANNPNGYTKDLADFLAPFVSTYGLLIEKDKIAKQEELNKQALIKVKENAEVNEKRYKGLIDNLRAGVVVHAADTSIIANNLQAEKLLGLSSEQLEGKKAYDEEWHFTDLNNNKLVAEEYPVNTILRTKKPLKNYQAGVYYPTSKSKVYLSVNGFPVFNSSGEISEIVISFVDVSSTKKAEIEILNAKESAELNEKFYRTIINSIGDPLFVKDKESKLLLVNNAFCEIFNLNRAEIIGKTLAEDVTPEERESFLKIDKQVFQTGKENITEESLTVRGGETRAISTRKSRFVDNFGEKFLVGVIRDLTEQKRTQIELKAQNQQLQAGEQQLKATNQQLAANEQQLRAAVMQLKAREQMLKSANLREKEMANIVRLATVAIAFGYPDGRLENCNTAFSNLTGYSLSELKEINWNEVLTPSKWNEFEDEKLKTLSPTNNSIQYEKEYIRKDGSIVPIQLTVTAKFDEKGDLIHFIGFIIDITERKQAEENIRLSEEKYRALYQNAPLAYQSLNINGEIIDVNPQWLKTLNYKRDEAIGTWFGNFLQSDSKENFHHNFKRFKEKGAVSGVEFKMLKSNGAEITVSFEGCIGYDDKGDFKQTYCTFKDITQQKKAEQELILAKEKAEENEQELLQAKEIEEKNVEMILSSQSIAHICSYSTNLNKTDIEKSVWDCSPEFYKIFGIDETYPHTIAGWANFIHPDYREKLLAYHESVIKNRGSFNNEYKIIRINDGEERWVHGTGELVYDEQGSPVRMFGAIQDITELKQTESELIKAKDKAEESDRLKSAFLANMSHEIRTPMNGILGFTNLLRNPDLTGKQQQDYVKIIQKSGDRMLNTVNDIIEISQIETGQITVTANLVNISKHLKTLNEFFRLEAENKGLQLMIDNQLAKADSLIQTDENKFGSILINLIKNAIKFTDKGRIIIGCKKKGEFIEFNVKDTGVGIPANRTEAIFNRFEQADIEDSRALQGSGLGLSIVHSYVDMLGGEIWVKSKEGVGSQFYFTLPYNTVTIKTPEKNLDTLNKSNIQNKGLKVLISDDDETAIMYLKIILEEFEKEILIAKNGIEAVEICRQHSDIDLILMDIKMPGLNGYEATEKIREFNDRVFIVAQTAFALPGDREKALEAGCDDYISKPINRDVLLELIKKQF